MANVILASPALVTAEPPAFRLSAFLDITRPVDYFILHDAHCAACSAFCGPEFRAAVQALGAGDFLEAVIAANYTRITAGQAQPPRGYLMDTPGSEQPTEAAPFLWWWINR